MEKQNKQTCTKCAQELKWGGFTHKQNICWECFVEEFAAIINQHEGKEKEILNWMMALVTEEYGYEW